MASRQVYIDELTTVDMMAKRWKMSVGQVSNIVCGRDGKKRTHFPEPIAGSGTRAVWLWSDAQEWYSRTMPKQQLEERRASKKSKKRSYVNQPLSA